MTMAHDLLTEPILSWRDTSRRRGMTTLPGILAKLAAAELGDYPRVQAHQFHPWSMFLTQLAAIALRRAGATDPRISEDEWRAMLVALTDGAHEPWCLVVENLSKPAFFQPPVPEASQGWSLTEHWKRAERPDEVDVLVTSKAHDVKQSRLDCAVPELWVYALVTLQTMQGYPGRGYNGIARMKGGYGSRPRVGLAPDCSPAGRFDRDVAVLLDSWRSVIDRGFRDHGIALVWTEPWDGIASLDLADLSPHFIELCWRVRCLMADGGLHCAYTTTQNRRCLPSLDRGDVGDVWIPLGRDGGALTVGAGGFHYQRLSEILLGDEFKFAAAQCFRAGDSDPVLLVSAALARGQGKTDGLHERSLLLPGQVRRWLGQPDQRAALGRRAVTCVERAKKMRSNVLFPALKQLALGEKTMEDAFDAEVDDIFFGELFGTLEQDDDAARLGWEKRLVTIARHELRRAIDHCVLADAQRYRAIAGAEAMFGGCLRKVFPDAVAPTETDGQEHQQGDQP